MVSGRTFSCVEGSGLNCQRLYGLYWGVWILSCKPFFPDKSFSISLHYTVHFLAQALIITHTDYCGIVFQRVFLSQVLHQSSLSSTLLFGWPKCISNLVMGWIAPPSPENPHSWITAFLWWRGLWNSMKLWATQDGQVIVESSHKTWSTGGGNVKPLWYSCWENPMNYEKAKIYDPRRWDPSRKTSISASLTMPKPLTVWITILWKILKEMGITRPPNLPLEKSVCRPGSNS